jgi:hypothetical protein
MVCPGCGDTVVARDSEFLTFDVTKIDEGWYSIAVVHSTLGESSGVVLHVCDRGGGSPVTAPVVEPSPSPLTAKRSSADD